MVSNPVRVFQNWQPAIGSWQATPINHLTQKVGNRQPAVGKKSTVFYEITN